MRQIMENLSNAVVLSPTFLQELGRHLDDNYPHLSPVDRDKVVRQYLEKQIDVYLNYFDDQYRSYIRRQLYLNITTKKPGEVSGLDILKACLQMNFEVDSFYRELKQWILSYPANRGLDAEVTGLIALLRQVVKDYPEMTLEELIATEQLLMDAAAQVINENPSDVSWRENEFGSMIPVDQIYYNGNQWDETAERNQVFQKRIAFITLAVASFGLVLLSSFSMLKVSSNKQAPVDRQVKVAQQVIRRLAGPARKEVQIAQTAPTIPAVQPKPSQISQVVRHCPLNKRLKRNSIVSRFQKRETTAGFTKKTSTPQVAALVPNKDKTPVKIKPSPAPQTVIVGYTLAYNGVTTIKVPLLKTFSNKLKLKANSYAVTPDNESAVSEAAEDGNWAPTGVEATKGKIVTADPKLIPSGSRVYIKHSPEYGNLDGIYTVEAADTGKAANQTKIVLGESASGDRAANTDSAGNDQHEVEVYVLDNKE
jgi:3D (Asp-Asp-Asp) domain-containing protein